MTTLAIDRMGCRLGWRLLRVSLVVEDRVLVGGYYARVSVIDVKIQIFTLQHFWLRWPELIAHDRVEVVNGGVSLPRCQRRSSRICNSARILRRVD